MVVPNDEKGIIEVVPLGTDERIKLSVAIVQKLVATPTRTGKIPDANQCIKFMMLCRARHLNPFEGDAYMLGYDTQTGPQWSLITAHQVFLKRAEASKGFNGMESGVIVKMKDGGGIIEREGDLTYDDEILVGGWAKVYRKDREKPFYRRLKLATFNTGRSRWEKDPAGMIVKCAEADSLRTAFPTHLGGLYVEEELPPIDVNGGQIPITRPKIQRLTAPSQDLSGDVENARTDSNRLIPGEDVGGEKAQADGTKPTSGSSAPPAQTYPKRKLKKKAPPLHEIPKAGENESQMLMRLAGMERTKEQLVQVARQFDALKENEGWDDVGEQGFEVMLDAANWPLLEAELKAIS